MAKSGALKKDKSSTSSEPSVRKKMVRQDRWELEPNTAFLRLGDKEFEVINLSTFGCAAFFSTEQTQFFRQMTNAGGTFIATLVFKGIEVQTLSLRPVRIEEEGRRSNYVQIGCEAAGEPIVIETCRAIDVAGIVVERQRKITQQTNLVPADFKRIIYELFGWLQSLKTQIDAVEKDLPVDDIRQRQEFHVTISECISDYLNEMIPSIYQAMPEIVAGLPKDKKRDCYEFARNVVGPLVFGAPFANRAYFKPLGYAGDYEMINYLYRDELMGRSLYDQCVHKYFVDEPAAQAIKNCGEYLFQKIRDLVAHTPAGQPLKIFSVACGPALEQQLFLEREPQFYGRTIEFHCLDQDEVSLKHTQRKLLSLSRLYGSQYRFFFHHMSIKNVISSGLPETNCDLVYSTGLCFVYGSNVGLDSRVSV